MSPQPVSPELMLAAARGPQVEDIQTARAKALTLQNLAQQQQLGQQQLQGGGLELQQKQQDFQDQQKIRQLYMDAGGDLDKLQTSAMKSGVSPRAVMAIQQQKLAMQKEFAGYDEVRLKNDAARHDQLRGQLNSFLAQDDATKAANWQPWIQGHVQSGALTAAEGQQLLQQHQAYPGDDVMKIYGTGLATGSQYAEEEIKRRNAAAAEIGANSRDRDATTRGQKQENEAPGQIANAEQAVRSNLATKLAAAAGQGPDALTAALQDVTPNQQKWFAGAKAPADFLRLGQKPEQIVQSDQAAADAAQRKIRDLQTQANEAAMRGQGEKRLFLESQAQKLRQETFNATIGQGLDANGQIVKGEDGKPVISPAAQLVADYDIEAPRLGRGMSSGMLAQVKTANPDYDAKNYATAKGIRSGKTASNIQALNTAIVHMDQLGDVGKALNNGTLVPGNAFFNSLQQTFGNAAPTNFEGLKNAVAGEMANALKGTATDPEIANISKTISGASSPDQLKGIIQENLKVLGAKLNTYDEQYHQAVGGKDPWKPVLPTAAAVLDKHGVSQKPQVGTAQLPAGAGKAIDAATAKQFYDAAGGDPQRARALAISKGWKIQ